MDGLAAAKGTELLVKPDSVWIFAPAGVNTEREKDCEVEGYYCAATGRRYSAMSASTSERLGVPAEPPSRVHLMPATAAPKRMASTSLWPSASASAKPPWKASPAPIVSTAAMLNTGKRRTASPSR